MNPISELFDVRLVFGNVDKFAEGGRGQSEPMTSPLYSAPMTRLNADLMTPSARSRRTGVRRAFVLVTQDSEEIFLTRRLLSIVG
jgi:hypothetical protein